MKKIKEFTRRDFLGKITACTIGVASINIVDNLLAAVKNEPSKKWEQKSDRKIRIGVVGGGFGAYFFWNQHPNCIVEAVSDLQKDRRNRLMKVYKCNKSYKSLEKLVLDDKIEAIAVFTDAPSHGRHIVEVLKHGKHCITAVPLAMTLDDIYRVKELKEKTGLKVMMAETSSYHSALYNAKLIYEEGLFGKIVYSEGEYYHPHVDTASGYKEWRNAIPPMLYPTHATAYYIGVTGKRYTSVSCLGFKGKEPRYKRNSYNNPFSSETALFETSEGGMSRMNIFWGAEGVHGVRGRLFGELGHFYNNVLHFGQRKDQKKIRFKDRRPPLPPNMSPGGHGGSHGPLANEFIMALLENREPWIDLYEAIAMTAPGIVAHQSALKNGERLKIPSFDI